MESSKRLRSVVQSIAHHAASGLCYLHPHLGEYGKNKSINKISVNLLSESFEPPLQEISSEIEMSVSALREKFEVILKSEKMCLTDIKDVVLEFEFDKDDYPRYCYAKLTVESGKIFESAITSGGEVGEILRKHS